MVRRPDDEPSDSSSNSPASFTNGHYDHGIEVVTITPQQSGQLQHKQAATSADGLDRLGLLQPIPKDKQVSLEYHNVKAWAPMFMKTPGPAKLAVNFVKNKARTHGDRGLQYTQILHNISGCCRPGEVLALMGPSGSGKTTLLTIMGGRAQRIMKREGDVLYNDTGMEKSMKRNIGFVMQDDLLYEALTVYETLWFAAMLRLPKDMSEREKSERVNTVVQALGLDGCKNTIVGGFFRKGISGGERKRTSIGHELLINPSVLLLDEPTSGLDSTVSMHLLSILRGLAQGGRSIVTTIHQPSSRLYQQLDKLLLLSKGHAMYYGSSEKVVDYLEGLGYPLPYAMNTADFILDLASGEISNNERSGMETRDFLVTAAEEFLPAHPMQGFTDRQQLQSIRSVIKSVHLRMSSVRSTSIDVRTPAAADEAHAPPLKPRGAGSMRMDGELVDVQDEELGGVSSAGKGGGGKRKKSDRWGATYATQLRVLFMRTLKTRRFDTLSVQDIVMFLVVGVLSGAFWWQRAGNDTVASARDTLGLLFFELMFLSFRTMFGALFTFPQEQKMMLKERASGMYRLSAFYFARMGSDLPMDFAVPTLFVIILYFMTGLRRTGAGYFFANYATVLLSSLVAQSWGLLFGVVVMNPKTAQTIATVVVLSFTLVGGFFITAIPGWIAWLKYLSFIYYAFGLLLHIEFGGRTMYNCTTYPGSCTSINLDNPSANEDVCTPLNNVVEDLALSNDPNSTAEVYRNVFVLLGMLVALRVVVYVMLRRKTAGM